MIIKAGKMMKCWPRRRRLRLVGENDLPMVDILLPSCGERVEIVLDTIRAACAIDYPASCFRVLVLDDKSSEELRHEVHNLQSKWSNLHYHTRGNRSNDEQFDKAGNLNYALFSLQTGIQPEFFAVFDADCIPSRDYLRATLPHLVRDSQAAVVTITQFYYNLPTGDPLHQAIDFLQSAMIPLVDLCGITIARGSGSLYRRSSMIDVGGFPTGSCNDSLSLSRSLQSSHYSSVYLPEVLQYGLVPTSLEGHINQRKRWCRGFFQQMTSPTSPSEHGVSRKIRQGIAWQPMGFVWDLINHAVGFVALPLVLSSGQQLIPVASLLWFKVQWYLTIIWISFSWISEWLQSARTDFRVPLFGYLEDSWLSACECTSRYFTHRWFRNSCLLRSGRSLFRNTANISFNRPIVFLRQALDPYRQIKAFPSNWEY